MTSTLIGRWFAPLLGDVIFMSHRIALIICLTACVFCTAAEACLGTYQQGWGFWDKAPADLGPQDVVVEVEFMGAAASVYRAATDAEAGEGHALPAPQPKAGDGPPSVSADEDIFFTTSCGDMSAYRVVRVLHGEVDSDVVLLSPLVRLHDETWNPFRKRILVGAVEPPIKIALTMTRDWREHVFHAAELTPRLTREGEQDTGGMLLSLPERIVFGGARLIAYGASLVPGAPASAQSIWVGLGVLVALAVCAVALLLRWSVSRGS